MNPSEESRGVIGFRTALVLFALLIAFAFWTLKGMALAIALIIVLALLAKTCVHRMRRRLE